MTSRPFFYSLSSVALLMLSGCGEETEGLPGIPLEQFSEQFRGATCEHITACNFMPDVATCMASIGTEQGIAQSVASATAGKLTYDPAAARLCVDTLRSAPCTGDFLIPRSIRQTCDAVFAGRYGEGESCFHAAECEGLDALCEGACDDQCCEGSCKLGQGFAKIGDPCGDMTFKPCGHDAYCNTTDPDAANWACSAKVAPGASCEGHPDACPDGYACDPSTATCFKQADPGGSCNPDLTADGCGHIAEYCDAATSKCKAYPKVGQPCVTTNAAANICAWGYSFCDVGAQTCIALPKEGEACVMGACIGGQLGSGIVSGVSCNNGTCASGEATQSCSAP